MMMTTVVVVVAVAAGMMSVGHVDIVDAVNVIDEDIDVDVDFAFCAGCNRRCAIPGQGQLDACPADRNL